MWRSKRAKIISIKGGLGNQMFQYAYGRKLMLVDKNKICFDTSFFTTHRNVIDTSRTFLLDKFKVSKEVDFKNTPPAFFPRLISKIKSKFTNKYHFYQGEQYFKDITNTVRQEFTLKDPLSRQSQSWIHKIESLPASISVHIRRGDYIKNLETNAYHGVCGVDYYQKSSELVENSVGTGDIEYFVFSDDILWAKENISFKHPTHFVSETSIPDYEELIIMSTCKHHIIANSTFSWWAAWLDNNPHKIVIAPKQWFLHKKVDIYPNGWLTI